MTDALSAKFTQAGVRAASVALSRGGRTLVRGLSFTAEPGEALVITGPNGAGKTTLLRAIAGFIRPDAGEIHVEPEGDVMMAWLGHADGLKPAETVRSALTFWARLHGASPALIEPVMERMAVAHLAGGPAARCRPGSAGARPGAMALSCWAVDPR
jgi:ABC-type transport system involved in cytochrome c biogenesis, ATPase component